MCSSFVFVSCSSVLGLPGVLLLWVCRHTLGCYALCNQFVDCVLYTTDIYILVMTRTTDMCFMLSDGSISVQCRLFDCKFCLQVFVWEWDEVLNICLMPLCLSDMVSLAVSIKTWGSGNQLTWLCQGINRQNQMHFVAFLLHICCGFDVG